MFSLDWFDIGEKEKCPQHCFLHNQVSSYPVSLSMRSVAIKSCHFLSKDISDSATYTDSMLRLRVYNVFIFSHDHLSINKEWLQRICDAL